MKEYIFTGYHDTPLYGLVAIPPQAKGTIIGTYGITGDLTNQWYLKILAYKAYHQGYAVILFDWRSHGKSALLSSALTSDGLYEGKDYVMIAQEAKKIGCPPLYWFTGYSLGGKLALWGLYEASVNHHPDIGGGCVICPSLDAMRSLNYLENHPTGRYIEQVITNNLKQLALELHHLHPKDISLDAISLIKSIKTFDENLVIPRLGFKTVEEYYHITSPLRIMKEIKKPTLILYAEDDPMFDPSIVDDLKRISNDHNNINLILSPFGGHVGFMSNIKSREIIGDNDPWWAWNRFLEYIPSAV